MELPAAVPHAPTTTGAERSAQKSLTRLQTPPATDSRVITIPTVVSHKNRRRPASSRFVRFRFAMSAPSVANGNTRTPAHYMVVVLLERI